MYSSAMVRPHLLPPSNSEVKHSLEVGEAAEPEPEPKEWAVTILNLTESFDSLTLASRCVTTSIQKILRNKDWTRNYVDFSCYGEISKDKNKSLSLHPDFNY
jgi:hypothetical protein